MADLCPSEGDDQHLTSSTGLLLRRLEAFAPAEEDCTSAYQLQAGTPVLLVQLKPCCGHLYDIVAATSCRILDQHAHAAHRYLQSRMQLRLDTARCGTVYRHPHTLKCFLEHCHLGKRLSHSYRSS